MRIITLHKILIASFSAFSLFFGIRELLRGGTDSNIIIAIGSILLAIAGIVYFTWVARGGYSRKSS